MAVSFFSVGGNLGSAISPLPMAAGLAAFGLAGTVILLPLALLAGRYFSLAWAGKTRASRPRTAVPRLTRGRVFCWG